MFIVFSPTCHKNLQHNILCLWLDFKKLKMITRSKLIAKQREGIPLMSKVKIEVPPRSRVLKLIDINNLNKKKPN